MVLLYKVVKKYKLLITLFIAALCDFDLRGHRISHESPSIHLVRWRLHEFTQWMNLIKFHRETTVSDVYYLPVG